jgi:hypothetical protein
MNYNENQRNILRQNTNSSNQKKQYDNIASDSNFNNLRGKSSEIKKGISLTPDRRNFTKNINSILNTNYNRKNNSNYSNNSNYKLNTRNFSLKKTDQNNKKFYDNGNMMEKYSQKDNSQISNNNDYSNNYNNDYSLISRISNRSSVQNYLDRRHIEAKQKINKLRMDKLNQESSELKFKPKISENSKKIVQNLVKKDKAIKINSTLLNIENCKNHYIVNRITDNINNKNLNQNNYENGFNPSPNPKMKNNHNNNIYNPYNECRNLVYNRELISDKLQINAIEVKNYVLLIYN